jgi:flagellar motility protein MotE (MotC chaperone)
MMSRFRILPILIVIALFAFSVRVVDVASNISNLSGTAYAVEKSKPKVEKEEKPEASKSEEMPEAKDDVLAKPSKPAETDGGDSMLDWVDAGDADIDYSEVKMDIFNDLSARRKSVDDKERRLITREALLEAAEQELDRKYQEMLKLRGEIEGLLDDQSVEEQARIASLVKIYEGMKPKQAASIFNTLDIDVLTSVMGNMSERRLSPILAAMNPERARSVTIILAEQKKLPELPQN